jgi:hypothetical protein
MTHVYRITYSGICELLVEADGTVITKLIAATGDSALVGRLLDDLPKPDYIEAKLLAEYSSER